MAQKLNSIGKTIYDIEGNEKLDSCVKRLLSQPQILAFILKHTVEEFSRFSAEEIVDCIIDVSVRAISAEPGSTNNVITGAPQESSITGESSLLYDIRFFALLPGMEEKEEYSLIINIEAQAKSTPGYWPESRGILYCGRMLSEQMGRNVKDDHYENLKKVYSIWIIMNSSQRDANTIIEYGVMPRKKIGTLTGEPRTDLLSVVAIRLPKDDEWEKAKNPATELTKMLSTLLSGEIKPEDKINSLENEYGIKTTEEIRQEVNHMCDYSSAVEDKGKVSELVGLVYDGLLKKDIAEDRAKKLYNVDKDDFQSLLDSYTPDKDLVKA